LDIHKPEQMMKLVWKDEPVGFQPNVAIVFKIKPRYSLHVE